MLLYVTPTMLTALYPNITLALGRPTSLQFRVTTCIINFLSEPLKIETLVFKGNQVERETLTVIEQIPSSEVQQHIWNIYKNEMKYQW